MIELENIIRNMDLKFFGSGKHKVNVGSHFSKDNAVLLDVRSKQEVETLSFKLIYHMPVIHIPTCEIPDRVAEIPTDKPVGIFCSSGTRAAIVYGYLMAKGYTNARVLEGGYSAIVDELKPGKLLKQLLKNEEKID